MFCVIWQMPVSYISTRTAVVSRELLGVSYRGRPVTPNIEPEMGFCNQLNYPALMVRHGQSQCIIRIAIQFPDLQLTGEIDTIPGWFTEKSWICNKNCEHWSHFILVCLEYVRELLEEVMQLRQDYPCLSLAERGLVAAEPHLLTESMDVVSKDDLIAQYQSRYPQPETS